MFGLINGGGVRTCLGSSTEVELSTEVQLERLRGHQRMWG